jgi:DNA end-binding protein Ku
MRRAMQETDTVAIGKVALRDKEHLSAISIKESTDGEASDGTFLLNTLYWPDEIRATNELKVPTDADVQIQDRELKMAVSLVENLITDYRPEQYRDNYREALLEVINDILDFSPRSRPASSSSTSTSSTRVTRSRTSARCSPRRRTARAWS